MTTVPLLAVLLMTHFVHTLCRNVYPLYQRD
jgi:hypothetical protein